MTENSVSIHDRKWASVLYLVPWLGAGGAWSAFIIAPLIVWILKKDESQFLDFHGRQVINLEINVLISSLLGYGILLLMKVIQGADSFTPAGSYWLVMSGVGLIGVVLIVLALSVCYVTVSLAKASYRGEWREISGPFGKKWF